MIELDGHFKTLANYLTKSSMLQVLYFKVIYINISRFHHMSMAFGCVLSPVAVLFNLSLFNVLSVI